MKKRTANSASTATTNLTVPTHTTTHSPAAKRSATRKAASIARALIIALFTLVVLNVFAACTPKEKAPERSRYTIAATYDEEAHAVTADMTVSYLSTANSVLDEVCFHLYPAAFREGARFSPVPKEMVSSAYPAGVSFGGIEITSLSVGGEAAEVEIAGQDEDLLVVRLKAGNELYPGDRAEIAMSFTVTLPCVRHRLGYEGRRVNLGNWYPIACVYENGNFVTDPYYSSGDPFYSECADYEVSLSVPADLAVAMSGRTSAREEGGRKVFSAEIRGARDFAAVIGEMKMLGTEVGGVEVNYYYSADPSPETSLAAATDAIKTFSDMFGDYPYESYSAVETGFLHGGMEYPALAMISDALSGELYTEAIIHETAHQWWYAAVGNDEVSDAWMDEGLAEYSTSMFYERNPSYNVSYEKRMADALSAYILYYDTFRSASVDTSMDRRLPEYASSFEYTYMTYVKGELMFEALRSVVGDDAFIGGLREYYKGYKFANAAPDDMIGCFERASGRELKSFMSSWLEGKVNTFGGPTR